MRNATIRRKHVQAQRMWLKFIATPQRINLGADYRETNLDAFKTGRIWSIHG